MRLRGAEFKFSFKSKLSKLQENLILSSRNIRNVFIENVKTVSVYDLLDSEIILIDKLGINTFSEVLA